jgi:hypothetical protein
MSIPPTEILALIQGRGDRCLFFGYPWEDAHGVLHVPAEDDFPRLEALHQHRAGTTFLKIVATAVMELGGGSDAAP